MSYVLDSLLFADVEIYSGISLRDLAGRKGKAGRARARMTRSRNDERK
jgi:hypothetical protein